MSVEYRSCDNFDESAENKFPSGEGKFGERADPVVRYGADYPNGGYQGKNKGKSAPNAPYATT
ncbi:hypothetical protein [Moorena sp. SIO3B2]|uniref:hypothetical protein n=1 Tax=Moorena sp. SIO3B2 TaxID=2607827 RepID=UPI0013C89FB8|nr:hypothetical protein [Moorena sp. SIO3B2]NEP36631.1 hypothetical protein [Moorena sp. SIO3B2]